MMPDDEHVLALWGQALSMTGDLTAQACQASGLGSTLTLPDRTRDVQATIAAAGIQACGTIFAALIEADMLRQLKEASDVRKDDLQA